MVVFFFYFFPKNGNYKNHFWRKFWENNKNHFFKKLVRINGSIIIIVWPCRNLQIFMVFIWMWYSDKMLRKITKKSQNDINIYPDVGHVTGQHQITWHQLHHVVQFWNQKIVIGMIRDPRIDFYQPSVEQLEIRKFTPSQRTHYIYGRGWPRGKTRLTGDYAYNNHRWLSQTKNFEFEHSLRVWAF